MSTLSPTPVAAKPASRTAPQRSLLIDAVKGMAILLVAFGHTMQGLVHRYQGAETGWSYRTDMYIYSFHMPAFFFVSGVFVLNSLHKRGVGRFIVSKLETVMYPFWLWACIVLPWLPLVFGRFMNQKLAPIHGLLLNPLTGNYGWFLPSLFVALLLAALLRRVPMAVLFAASWIVSILWRFIAIDDIDRGLTLLPFLVAGMWIGPRVTRLDEIPRWQCGVLAAVAAYVIWLATPIGVQPLYWGFVPVGLLGTAMLLFLGRLCGTGGFGRFFAWLGVASLAIFLFAPFGQVAARAFLERFGVHNMALHLILGTAASTLPVAWIYGHRERWKLGWAFAWPF